MSEWQAVKIGSFLTEREGRYKPTDTQLQNIPRLDKIDFSGTIHLSSKPTKTDMIIIQPGDLVISGINVAKGAIAIWDGGYPITATIHFSSYIFDKAKIDIDFFKRYFKSPAFIKALKNQVKGGIKTEIKANNLLPLQVNIPLLPTQHKVKKYFESFESDLSDLTGEIANQAAILAKLRQVILQEAIEGKLTADWRDTHPVCKGDAEYDAGALLEKIQEKKRKLVAAGKIRKEKSPRISRIDTNDMPFAVPEGWVWTRLGKIAESLSTGPFGSMLHKSDYVGDGIPLINPKNITDTGIVSDSNMLVSRSKIKELKRYILKENDIIIARRGNLSKCAVLKKEQENWLCGTGSFFMRILEIDTRFFVLTYQSKFFQLFLMQNSIGQTMNNLNQKLLAKAPVPLPPLAEQRTIVLHIEKILAMINELDVQVKERQGQTAELLQAVLREAFEG